MKAHQIVFLLSDIRFIPANASVLKNSANESESMNFFLILERVYYYINRLSTCLEG